MKWPRLKGLLLSYWYFSKNSPDRLFDVFYWPVLEILIWGFMTLFIQGISEVRLLNAVLGGVILWIFVWRSSQDIVVYLLEQYWSRTVYYLFASPVTASEVMVSLCIIGIFRSLISFAVLSTLSYLLYHFNFFAFPLSHALLYLSILLLFGWSVGLLISSLVLRYGSRVQVLAWSTIWVIQPFSCVFYPLQALPAWAQMIARWLPTTHVFEGLRNSLQGQPLVMGSMLYALGSVLVLLLLASLTVSAALQQARKRGSFAKPE